MPLTISSRLPQRILTLSFALACASIVGILVLTTYEVFVRYVLNQPTTWATDSSTYLLCVAVFFTLPKVTAEGTSVAVNILTERLSEKGRLASTLIVEVIMAIACALTFVMCIDVTLEQFATAARTVDGIAFPRWILTAVLAYGFGMACLLHVLRGLGFRNLHDAASGAQL